MGEQPGLSLCERRLCVLCWVLQAAPRRPREVVPSPFLMTSMLICVSIPLPMPLLIRANLRVSGRRCWRGRWRSHWVTVRSGCTCGLVAGPDELSGHSLALMMLWNKPLANFSLISINNYFVTSSVPVSMLGLDLLMSCCSGQSCVEEGVQVQGAESCLRNQLLCVGLMQ